MRPRPAFLASQHLSGIASVLPGPPSDVRTVFVPTAGSIFDEAPWVDDHRRWFRDNGFLLTELELATATAEGVRAALAGADLVYVAGGHTYSLLHHMQRTAFWAALDACGAVYSGSSAGAIVACPDIAYIEDLDDASMVPELVSTTGGGLVDVRILPHADDAHYGPMVARIAASWDGDGDLVVLRDDQAVVLLDDGPAIVSSPAGPLP